MRDYSVGDVDGKVIVWIVRRAGVDKKIWRHNDVGHLEELLAAEVPELRPKDE